MSAWEGLNPPYRTIVVDPPWHYAAKRNGNTTTATSKNGRRRPMPYSTLDVSEIMALPVDELAALNAHLYLWTTNRYLRDAYAVVEAWGFRPAQVLVWCKPSNGVGHGGAFANSTEFVLFARLGVLPHQQRIDSTWFQWQRGEHSIKPPAFMDLVERVSPGPYVDLFCREPRFGWDSWGYGYESVIPR